jgi:hypothetical protein
MAIEGVVFEDRPLAEVARALGVPIGTLKSRLHRARGHIKEELTLPVWRSWLRRLVYSLNRSWVPQAEWVSGWPW